MALPAYEELFSRNIGVFTPEQQERVRGLKVAIAGCGGIGSPTAICMARVGAGEIRLADPEVFEASNINRQFGAYVDTIGRSKALAVADEIRRINPYAKVVCFEGGVTAANLDDFLEGADCVVDALDFYATPTERALHSTARTNGQWVFTGLQAGTMCVFTAFSPSSRSYEELFCLSGEIDLSAMLRTYFPVRPREATDELVEGILAGEKLALPFLATATMIAGGWIVNSILRKFIWGEHPAVAPEVQVLDLRQSLLATLEAE